MSDFSINIDGGTRVLQKLAGLSEFLKNPKDTLDEIGEFGIEEVHQQFETEGTRLSSKWKKLAKSTQRQKAMMGYGGKKILERSGALKGSVIKETSKLKVTIRSTAKHAEYHQLGMGYNPVRKIFATNENFKQNIVELINKGIRSKIT